MPVLVSGTKGGGSTFWAQARGRAWARHCRGGCHAGAGLPCGYLARQMDSWFGKGLEKQSGQERAGTDWEQLFIGRWGREGGWEAAAGKTSLHLPPQQWMAHAIRSRQRGQGAPPAL